MMAVHVILTLWGGTKHIKKGKRNDETPWDASCIPVVAPPLISPDQTPLNLSNGGKLCPLNPCVLVRCRSVFSHMKWNLRSLTVAELLAVYGIPQQEKTTAVRYCDVSELCNFNPRKRMWRSAPKCNKNYKMLEINATYYPGQLQM